MSVTQEPALLQSKVEEFLTYCGARNLSQNTIRAYRADLAGFLAVAGGSQVKVTSISRKLVRAYIAQLSDAGIARNSASRKLAAVKALCKWLDGEGLIESTTIESISGPRRRQELPDVPSEADMTRFVDGEIPSACPERDRVIVELLYGCGLRVAELCGLNLGDFRDEDVILVRGKGRKERLVIVGEHAQRAIAGWLPVRARLLEKLQLQTDALLFGVSGNRLENLNVRSVRRVLNQISDAKGLPHYNPHLLRHACGTHMHDHGAPLQAVAVFLGHARLSTAQIYTRVSVGRMMDTYRKAHPHAGSR